MAVIVRNFSAEVTIEESDHFEILRGPADAISFPNFAGMVDLIGQQGCYGGVRLIKAAIKRFAQNAGQLPSEKMRFTMSYRSDVPRQVGLAGSSALVMAAIRALMAWFEVKIEPFDLAEMTLAAEVEDLGIAAGPMDRAIQAYEGVLHMDFKSPRRAEAYTRLDPKILPPLYIAYDPRTGEISGKVHSDVRLRWLKGDPEVREAMSLFPKLVDDGMICLTSGNLEGFRKLMDQNFNTRAKIWNLSPRDHEMVRIGRDLGAAVKFSGSGGAVVGAMPDESLFPAIERAYTQARYRVIRPQIEPTGA